MPKEEDEGPWKRRLPLLIGAASVLFLLIWWLLPLLLYRHTGTAKDVKLKAITDTRTALLAGLIGVGALLTFWLNSRVYRITARTLEVTEQGHITERYTKAIEQLGSDRLGVRLGGIYALERIAKDSERDHPTVVEVLSAFVREESRKQSATQARQEIAQDAAKADTSAPEREGAARLAPDIQAVLTVLGRLPHRPEIPRADLSEAQLSGARLAGANLSGATLIGADLSDAQLNRAKLSGAVLGEANLSGAWLIGADLSGAQLAWANLSGARLAGANLSGAGLQGTNLSRATLYGVDLRQAQELMQPQLDVAWGDARTQLPAGLEHPASWPTAAPPPASPGPSPMTG